MIYDLFLNSRFWHWGLFERSKIRLLPDKSSSLTLLCNHVLNEPAQGLAETAKQYFDYFP